MKTLGVKTDKIQEYKNGGGKVTSTVAIGENVFKQEVRTTSQENFEQLKNNFISKTPVISDNKKYIEG